jgi:hypothetical protein
VFNLRSKLVTGAAMVAAIAASAGIAAAASGGNSGSASSGTQETHTANGRSEQPLTGSTADKVKGRTTRGLGVSPEQVVQPVDGWLAADG